MRFMTGADRAIDRVVPGTVNADAPMALRVVAGVLGLGLFVNAVVMLIHPAYWYHTLPGVSSTGPLNDHFVRDISCANLVVGVVLLAHALRRTTPVSGVVAAAGFLGLHAGLHAWELPGAGPKAGHRVVRDLSTVYLPAILAAWVAIDARRRARTHAGA